MDLTQAGINASDTLREIFTRARNAYSATRMPTAHTRRVALAQLDRLLSENANEIAAAISADFGNRSRHETQLLEIFPSRTAVNDAKRHVRSWMKPRRSWASMWFLPARTELRPQPLGVIGIIVPWNYPVFLAVAPLAGALAAGNRVMIKMSEFTPKTGALFAQLVTKYFSPDHVSVINGGADVAREFATLPFDHLLLQII